MRGGGEGERGRAPRGSEGEGREVKHRSMEDNQQRGKTSSAGPHQALGTQWLPQQPLLTPLSSV